MQPSGGAGHCRPMPSCLHPAGCAASTTRCGARRRRARQVRLVETALASSAMNPAPNLVLVGPMGAGKSSIGKRLAERFGLAFADADRDIELRTGHHRVHHFRLRRRSRFPGARARGAGGVACRRRPAGRHRRRCGARSRQPPAAARARLRRLPAGRRRTGNWNASHATARGRCCSATIARTCCGRWRRSASRCTAEVADLCFDTNHLATADAASALAKQLAERWQRGAVAA